jgi:hypothetical protein
MPGSTPRRFILTVSLLLGVGGIVVMFDGMPNARESTANEISLGRIEIAERGRLVVDLDTLSPDQPLRLALRLTEDKDEDGAGGDLESRPVRIIRGDGRRLETTGARSSSPSTPKGSSLLNFEIARGFLAEGSYLIEIDTRESHPLNLRRYILVIQGDLMVQ